MKLKELKEKRAVLAEKMHEIHSAAETEDRGFNDEERSDFDAKAAEIQALDQRIADGERAENLAKDGEALNGDREEESRQRHDERRRSYQDDPNRPLNSVERSRAIVGWALGEDAEGRDRELAQRAEVMNRKRLVMNVQRSGVMAEEGEEVESPRTIQEAREQHRQRVQDEREMRAQGLSPDASGGFTVPNAMMRTLEIALLAFGGMRQVAEILTTNTGSDLPMPTTNDTNQKGVIVAEHAPAPEQDIAFAQEVLKAYLYSSKVIKVSYQLMQDSATNMAALIGRLSGERIGRIHNEHFTTGDAASKPSGIVNDAANSGVTAATAGELAWGELLDLKHSVDPAYRVQGAGWMVADATLLKMKKIQDSQGRPLWLPSLVTGGPDLFDGDPVMINQEMPTAAAGKGVLYGLFSKYIIREVRAFEMMRLNELYATNHQVGFLGFNRADGKLLDAGTAPVKYLTLA